MSKNIRKNILGKKRPVKLPTVLDQTIKLFISDLIDRAQVPVLKHFAQELGFRDSQVINALLKDERNFPKAKYSSTIELLVTKYNANKNYLLTGHGDMYKGRPYMSVDSVPAVQQHKNIFGIGNVVALKKLQEKNKELEAQNKKLQEVIKAQQDTIDLQKKYIGKIEK